MNDACGGTEMVYSALKENSRSFEGEEHEEIFSLRGVSRRSAGSRLVDLFLVVG
jgi:hypothetical protein